MLIIKDTNNKLFNFKASFECPSCHTTHKPFGPGYISLLISQFGIKSSFAIPLFPSISHYSDTGVPTVLILPPQHTITQIYESLAKSVVNELEMIEKGERAPPHVRYETGNNNLNYICNTSQNVIYDKIILH